MSDRLIEITALESSCERLQEALSRQRLHHLRMSSAEGGRRTLRGVVSRVDRQAVLDAAQNVLEGEDDWEILILPLEAALPREESARPGSKASSWTFAADTREELYEDVASGSRIDALFLALCVLSTIVVAVGLVTDSVAVVIGGMVIAPLLGPNLALAMAISLGDRDLLFDALGANAVGFSIALVISVGIGVVGHVPTDAVEIATRTDIGFAGIVLALASGFAAALSLAAGLSGTLVGVMVAVALMPPACTFGMLLGAGRFHEALGAGLLLAVNVACIHIAAHAVFFMQGLRPRGWRDVASAHQSTATAAIAWLVLLALLVAAMLVRHA